MPGSSVEMYEWCPLNWDDGSSLPVWLRGGDTATARGAASLAAEAVGTAREAGAAAGIRFAGRGEHCAVDISACEPMAGGEARIS